MTAGTAPTLAVLVVGQLNFTYYTDRMVDRLRWTDTGRFPSTMEWTDEARSVADPVLRVESLWVRFQIPAEPILFCRDKQPMLRSLWRHRQLIRLLTIREIQQRYRGSGMGVLWNFILPFLMLLVYTFAFGVVFKARWDVPFESSSVTSYALVLFTGLIPFQVFAEVMNRSPSLLLSVPQLVKKVIFPLEVLPLVAVGSVVIQSLMTLSVLLLFRVLLTGRMGWTVLFLPVVYLPLIFLCTCVSWSLSALGVYLRDLTHLTPVLTQMFLFLTPVFYPTQWVPEGFRWWMTLNPMAFIVEQFRRVILWDQPPVWQGWLAWNTVMLVGGSLSYVWFVKAKKGFPDVL